MAATLGLVAVGFHEEIGHADVALVLGSKVNADGIAVSAIARAA